MLAHRIDVEAFAVAESFAGRAVFDCARTPPSQVCACALHARLACVLDQPKQSRRKNTI